MTVLTESDIERIERATKKDVPLDCYERYSVDRDVLILCAEWRKANVKRNDVSSRIRPPTDPRYQICALCNLPRSRHHVSTLACPDLLHYNHYYPVTHFHASNRLTP